MSGGARHHKAWSHAIPGTQGGKRSLTAVAHRLHFNSLMIEVRQTEESPAWPHDFSDPNAVARVLAAFAAWNREIPDFRNAGEGVMEMRIPDGPGYRIYYLQRGAQPGTPLSGGEKRHTAGDIKLAQTSAETLRCQR